ncbi:MAG: glycosyltransferase family 9 protein [Akkermansiaceae bacterium]|nr:glycosyltransferase family 9 protein [Akkermansiaceae bacterium]
MSDAGATIIASPEAYEEACFSIPAVRALHYAGAKITVTAAEKLVPLWESVTEVSEVIPHNGSARKLAKLVGGFAQSLAWEDGPPAVAFSKAGIAKRSGPPADKLAKLLTDPLVIEHKVGPAVHRVRHYLLIAEKMGAEPFDAVNFQPPPRATSDGVTRIGIAPGSDFGPSSEWPLARFQELAQHFGSGEFIIFPSPDRPKPAQALAKELGNRATLAPTDLAGQLALLAKCDLLIGNDGAIPHLAAHLGTRCLTLFGPNDPTWKRPLGTIHAIVHQLGPCSSCFLAKCPLDHRCLNEITVEEVFKKALTFFPEA